MLVLAQFRSHHLLSSSSTRGTSLQLRVIVRVLFRSTTAERAVDRSGDARCHGAPLIFTLHSDDNN